MKQKTITETYTFNDPAELTEEQISDRVIGISVRLYNSDDMSALIPQLVELQHLQIEAAKRVKPAKKSAFQQRLDDAVAMRKEKG